METRVTNRAHAQFWYGMVLALASLSCAAAARAEDGRGLVDALRSGGYVIVMRHARSPHAEPDSASAAPGNTDLERQLDQKGRETARAMGEAIRQLQIPVGKVLVSPTFRALETARLLDLGDAEPVQELGDGGQGMRRDSEGTRSTWLRLNAAVPPPAGTNRLMITHLPNLVGAFHDAAAGMGDGESLIVKPEGGKAIVVARVKIGQWPVLVP